MTTGILLAPGAGADRDQATLVALDRAATEAGFVVVRMDFPYRRADRRAPDRAPVLVEAVRAEAGSMAATCPRLLLGGRSMGGRMCSMAVASGLVPQAAGLILISYPLHPPGKPEKLRTEHFADLAVPCLFISGSRDAFGTPAELEAATAAIPSPVTHHWVEGKDHALRGVDGLICETTLDWMSGLEGQP